MFSYNIKLVVDSMQQFVNKLQEDFNELKENQDNIDLSSYYTRAEVNVQISNAESRANNFTEEYVDTLFNEVILETPLIATTEEEAARYRGTEESFEAVFNSWHRFSIGVGTNYDSPGVPSEVDAWRYDAGNDRVICTVNSTGIVGFVSPDSHEYYDFDVIVSSDNSDDDNIGLCAAYAMVDGVEHVITVMRTPGGSQTHPNVGSGADGHVTAAGNGNNSRLFEVYADFTRNSRTLLASTNNGLAWGDGVIDPDRRLTSDIGGSSRWRNFPDGCRIRIERRGDIFTFKTSNLGESEFVEEATLVVDLRDFPQLSMFRGARPYGYTTFSQPNATFETLEAPSSLQPVIDLSTDTYWTFNNGDWIPTPLNKSEILKPKSFYRDPTNNGIFITDLNSNIKYLTNRESILDEVQDMIDSDQKADDISDALISLLNTHKSSGDHDSRYNTKSEITSLLNTHKSSSDHDSRYHTKTENTNLHTTTLNSANSSASAALNVHKSSGDHDDRYHTKTEITSLHNQILASANQLTDTRYQQVLNELVKTDVQFATSTSEVAEMLGAEQSMEEIFNNWFRFSRQGNSANLESIPNELNAWSLDTNSNTLRCTQNTSSYIGFISPGKYDEYVLETQVKSSASDDDWITIIAAFVVDGSGNSHSLDVVYGMNGQGPLVVEYNHRANNKRVIHVTGSPLTWANGASGDTALSDNSGNGGWSTVPNGLRCRITRSGDIFKFETTQNNQGHTDNFLAGATFEIDLNDYPELFIFKGPQSYGYGCASQQNSTWDIIRKPTDLVPVIDLEAKVIWEYVDTDWVSSPIVDIFEHVDLNRIYRTRNQLFTLDDLGNVVQIGNSSSNFKLQQPITIAANNESRFNITQLANNHNQLDILAADIRVKIKNTDSSSSTHGMFINSEATIITGIENSNTVVVRNTTNQSLECYISIDIPQKI